MATSALGHYVRFGETAIDSLDPCDSGMLQRAIGNLNHVADQCAQVRVAWVGRATGNNYYTYDSGGAPAAGVYERIWLSTSFDMHLRSDGRPYQGRVRVRCSSNHATNAVWIRAVLAPQGLVEGEHFSAGTHVAEWNIARSTYSWETGTLQMDETVTMRAIHDAPIVDAVGGTVRAGQWLRVQLGIYATHATGAEPRVSGVQLAEYLEP